jgi:aryl-alcohol dehydrogenase-like predicted oxidoreductase
MEMRKLGRLEVSVVGLGCNNFGARCDEAGTAKVVSAAIDAGINFFDTADVYGGSLSEEYLGRALGARRDEVVIATKFGMAKGASGRASYIAQAVEDSLRRLGTDRIDLYQMHRPDPETPIAETLGALDRLVRDGKVLEIGNSNFTGEQIDEAEEVSTSNGLARFVSAQNHYNLLFRDVERDAIGACERHGLGMLPYFPLASGLLTGKYRGGALPEGSRLGNATPERRDWLMTERNLAVVDGLADFADARGISMLELAVGWLASRPTVASVIAGATKPEQVDANVSAGRSSPSAEDIAEIDRITAAG